MLGHLSVFFVFSFSFAPQINQKGDSVLYFLPQGLFVPALTKPGSEGIRHFFVSRTAEACLKNAGKPAPQVESVYLKPQVEAPFMSEKPRHEEEVLANLAPPLRSTAIIFHPQIPYSLAPYFKDRETVHIELMFNIVQLRTGSSVQVKRKVSSGNLEADLLSMRYISRYLSMQRQAIPTNAWQTVKIDLSVR